MRHHVQRWAAAVILAGAFCAMAGWTWGAWSDVLVDFGRELYAPWQISLGRVLYRDIAWLNGPLSAYVNAVWFWLFGVGLRSLVIGNLLLLALLLRLVHGVVRAISDRTSAHIATLTCIVMFGFSTPNYNFVCPYSHELTHGVFLAFAAIACFAAFLRSGATLPLAGCGLAVGLAFLTKAEVFLAIAIAVAAGVGASMWTGHIEQQRRTTVGATLAAGIVAPVVLAFLFFWRAMPAREAWMAAAGAWRYVMVGEVTSGVFYRRMAGLLEPGLSGGSMLIAAGVYALVFGIAALAAILSAKHLRDRILAATLAFGTGLVLFGLGTRYVAWDQAARPLPIFMLLLMFVVVAELRPLRQQPGHDRERLVLQLTLIAFALVLLARLALNATFYRYGFALAMPATVVLLVALLRWIPARLAGAHGDGLLFRAVVFAGWTVLMAAHLHGVSGLMARAHTRVGSGGDAFMADARADAVNVVLGTIAERTRPDQTLVALPEGVMLNYLSRRTNPSPFINFMPVELAAFGEARMLEALAAHPPDYIALVHKDTTEYGVPFFGRDYGTSLRQWMDAHYRVVMTAGAAPLESRQFGISLLELVALAQGPSPPR